MLQRHPRGHARGFVARELFLFSRTGSLVSAGEYFGNTILLTKTQGLQAPSCARGYTRVRD